MAWKASRRIFLLNLQFPLTDRRRTATEGGKKKGKEDDQCTDCGKRSEEGRGLDARRQRARAPGRSAHQLEHGVPQDHRDRPPPRDATGDSNSQAKHHIQSCGWPRARAFDHRPAPRRRSRTLRFDRRDGLWHQDAGNQAGAHRAAEAGGSVRLADDPRLRPRPRLRLSSPWEMGTENLQSCLSTHR